MVGMGGLSFDEIFQVDLGIGVRGGKEIVGLLLRLYKGTTRRANLLSTQDTNPLKKMLSAHN